jgi:hypothetical protein
MGRSATNVLGNGIAAAVVAKSEGYLQPAPVPVPECTEVEARPVLDFSALPMRRITDGELPLVRN